MSDTSESASSSERYWVIGIFGPILIIIPYYFIKIGEKRIHEMHQIKNVSLNILNHWIYQFLILSLYLQIIISTYATFVIIFCQANKDSVGYNSKLQDYNFMVRNQWISVLIVSILKIFHDFFWSMVIYFQVFEWVSIYILIRFE